MKKYLHALVFALLGLTAQAQQSTPAITLTAEVDGNPRSLSFYAKEAGQKFQIDWGDGKPVETPEIAVNDGIEWYTEVSGTPVGNGEIKIYGEGIDYLGAVSNISGAQITAIDLAGATDLTELEINGNDLKAIDLSQNTKLAKLTCSNNPIESLDLTANTALTRLDAQNMSLKAIDLSQNTALTYLHLGNNQLAEIDLKANTELASLYLLDNQLTGIDLSQNKKLTYISLNNNQLTSIDVTACEELGSLFCMNNLLTEAKVENVTKSVNLRGNYFTPATLPVANSTSYFYDQQNDLQIAASIETGKLLDLSAQTNITGLADAPQATVYTWTKEDGTALTEGTDYKNYGGRIMFLKAQDQPVSCTMETEAFPDATFKTTAVTVSGETVEVPNILLVAEVDGNPRTLTFAAMEAGHKFQIDWGDGKPVETEEIAVHTDDWTWTEVSGTPVGEGVIKIYGEGIDYFGCSSRVDGTQIIALDVTGAPDLTELTVNANKLTALDLSQNTKLTDLICSTNPIKQLDLSHNTELETLEANSMELESIDLSQNTKLTSIRLNLNQLESIDLSKNAALKQAYITDNKLSEIDLSNNDELTYVSLNNNLFTSIDVTGCAKLGTLFCTGNLQLTEIKIGDVTTRVNCSKNNFTLATLPVLTCKTFTYAPQNDLPIAEFIKVGETVDLSAQNNITGLADAPQATVYTWITAEGDTLQAGIDYTEEAGKFTFLTPQDSIYCTMETEAFPAFSGDKVFKTTAIDVIAPAVTLTAEVDGNPRSFSFYAKETGHKFRIDWGDGILVETEEIAVNDGEAWYTEVSGTPVGDGNIKIYGEGIDYFSAVSNMNGAQITAIDVTGATELTELEINGNDLKAIDLSQNTKLAKLTCSNNPIESLDLTANTALTRLDAQNMSLKAIDLSQNTALTYLHLGNNQLAEIDLKANTELASLYLLDNQLTGIDLSQNKKLTYISLNNNQLTSIDVTACEELGSLFCMNNLLTEAKVENVTKSVNLRGNHFTPATLPVANSTSYFYDQQADLQIAESLKAGETLDLSAQTNITGLADAPQATVYTWITAEGDTLQAGIDYTEEAGKFTFLTTQDSIYCTMETKAFPDATFKTTAIDVQGGGDGVESVSGTNAPVILGGKGIITVDHAAAGTTVALYDLSGRKVATQTSAGSRITFNVKPGLYIVSTGGAARKVNAF